MVPSFRRHYRVACRRVDVPGSADGARALLANGRLGKLGRSKDVTRPTPAQQKVNNDGVNAAKLEADE